jgi:two-component system CheB/CheR fusion protein
VGRSILDIRPNVEIKDLQKLLFLVIATGIPKELEIQEPQGIWYSVQLKSYRTSQNKIDGAVILFTDVTKIKTA